VTIHINKNGHKKGKQNYICVNFGRQFIEVYEPQRGYSKEMKREGLKMYVKKNKIWLWTEVDHFKTGILGWVLGDHSAKTLSPSSSLCLSK
jgi:hypothetical protein